MIIAQDRVNINGSMWPVVFKTYDWLRGELWNAPKSMWKIYFSRDGLCIFLRNALFHFRFIFPFKLIMCIFLGISKKKTKIKKWGISRKMHVINFKGKTNRKWNEAFRKKLHKPSREKYIFHILFGAFHNNPRTKS